MKYFKCLIFFWMFSVVYSFSVEAEVHYVAVVDHSFSPQNLTIDEGDSVIWIWQNDMHDVVAGTPGSPRNDIIDSGLLDTGAEFEVNFDRNFLNEFPVTGSYYDYFCTPHAVHMRGSITVNRPDKPFTADLEGSQAGSASSASGSCEAVLEGAEDSLTITCTHDVDTPVTAEIRQGSFGSDGTGLICSIDPAMLADGVLCELNEEEADALWNGEAFFVIKSGEYPAGEVRGQLAHRDGNGSVSGRVQLSGGHSVTDVVINNGHSSSSTNAFGLYSLQTDNGVRTLTAERSGFNIVATDGTNPVFVNNESVSGIDFIATFNSESECTLSDLTLSLEPLLSDYNKLKNLTRRSLRQFRNRTGQRRKANRLINRVNKQYSSLLSAITQQFPSGAAIVSCEICTSTDNSTLYAEYRTQARRWRRITMRHGRLAAASGLPEFRRSRQEIRSRRLLRSIRRGLNQLPLESYRC